MQRKSSLTYIRQYTVLYKDVIYSYYIRHTFALHESRRFLGIGIEFTKIDVHTS